MLPSASALFHGKNKQTTDKKTWIFPQVMAIVTYAGKKKKKCSTVDKKKKKKLFVFI